MEIIILKKKHHKKSLLSEIKTKDKKMSHIFYDMAQKI